MKFESNLSLYVYKISKNMKLGEDSAHTVILCAILVEIIDVKGLYM